MAKVENETIVDAPLGEVFDYVANPNNWPEFWPSLVKVYDVETLPSGGYTGKFEYKMAGMIFDGSGEYVKFAPNQWIVIQTQGGLKSTVTWAFRSMDDKTRVCLTIEYKIPVPLLGFLAEAMIQQMDKQDVEMMMKNLETRVMSWAVLRAK